MTRIHLKNTDDFGIVASRKASKPQNQEDRRFSRFLLLGVIIFEMAWMQSQRLMTQRKEIGMTS
jgi:hypothetical protein